jgi:biotin-dependent carboxylase-like uncharacterized protein
MDLYALQLANSLVGNDETEAALEITGCGPILKFESNSTVALVGGDFPMTLNEKIIQGQTCFDVSEGDILKIGCATRGFRGYLAIGGGYNLEQVLGSCSSDLSSDLGRGKLKTGEFILLKNAKKSVRNTSPKNHSNDLNSVEPIRVTAGPEEYRFTAEGLEDFYSERYKIAPASNRIGYRLEGKGIKHTDSSDIISSAVRMGTIQVPGNGVPLIMMAEHQTTGGYTRIAQVIESDLSRLAQKKPGDIISFKKISHLEAMELFRAQRRIQKHDGITKRYTITVDGKPYDVIVEVVE